MPASIARRHGQPPGTCHFCAIQAWSDANERRRLPAGEPRILGKKSSKHHPVEMATSGDARAYEGAERAPSGRKHLFGFDKMGGVPHLILNFDRGNWKSRTINIYKEDFWLGSSQVFGETQPFCCKKIVVSASQKGLAARTRWRP